MMRYRYRRDVLKWVSVGIPAVWVKPLVESVVLPAHATTTTDACNCSNACNCDCDLTITSSSVAPQSSPQGTTFNTRLDVQINHESPCVVFLVKLIGPDQEDYGVIHEECIEPLSPGAISLLHDIQAQPSEAFAFPPGRYEVIWQLQCNGKAESDQNNFTITA